MLIQFIVMQLVIFAVVIIILKKILLSDTMSAVGRLKKIEEDNKKKEEEIGIRILKAEEMCKDKVSQAQEEVLRIKDNAKKETDDLKKEMFEKARIESDRIMNAAKNIAGDMRSNLEKESGIKIIETASKLIKMVFTNRLRGNLNEELVKESITELVSIDKSNIKPGVNQILITSAVPVSGHLKDEIKKIISEKIGKELKLEEALDQSLIAGIVIKLDSLVIDASLANNLREASGELKKEIEK